MSACTPRLHPHQHPTRYDSHDDSEQHTCLVCKARSNVPIVGTEDAACTGRAGTRCTSRKVSATVDACGRSRWRWSGASGSGLAARRSRASTLTGWSDCACNETGRGDCGKDTVCPENDCGKDGGDDGHGRGGGRGGGAGCSRLCRASAAAIGCLRASGLSGLS